MEIKVCANQETGPFWGPEWGLNALIFGLKQPWDKEIKAFANIVCGDINGPTPRKGPKWEIFKKYSDELEDQMQRYLAWIISMTCRYINKIVQLLSLGLHMTPP